MGNKTPAVNGLMLHASRVDSKKRLWIWTGLVMVAGVGLAVSASASQPPPQRVLGPGARLLIIGDSLAQGLATPLRQIAQESRVEFSVDARSGTRIDQWANQAWLANAIATFRPTVILVSLGTNDMKLKDPSVQKPYLIKLATMLRGSGARVVWIAPPTMPFPDHGVQALVRSVGFPTFGSDALTIPRTSDGIHPTPVGYAGFAGSVWRWTDRPLAALGATPTKPRRWFEGRKRLDDRRRLVKG